MEPKDRKIGCELEFPIVRRSNLSSIRKPDIVRVWQTFLREHPNWHAHREHFRKTLTGVEKRHHGYNVLINTDNSVGQLEFAFGPEKMIREYEKSWLPTFRRFVGINTRLGFDTFGMSYHPMTHKDPTLRTPKDWYLVFHKKYFRSAHLCSGFAAVQPAVDVSKAEAFIAADTLAMLSPIMVAATANGPLVRGRPSGWKEYRIELWRELAAREQARNPGIMHWLARPFENAQTYVEWQWGLRSGIFSEHKQGGVYIPGFPVFARYIQSNRAWQARNIDGTKAMKRPTVSDIKKHAEYGWPVAKLHLKYDEKLTLEKAVRAFRECRYQAVYDEHVSRVYLEFRPIGTQPPGEHTAAMAWTMGIVCNLEEAAKLARRHSWDEWRNFLRQAAKHGMDMKIGRRSMQSWAKELLAIGRTGLKNRGFGEEKYLAPIEQRVADNRCPADEILDAYRAGGVRAVVDLRKFS